MTERLLPQLTAHLSEAQRSLFLAAYEQARTDGLCHEGALELAYEALQIIPSGKNQAIHIIQTEPTNPNTTPT